MYALSDYPEVFRRIREDCRKGSSEGIDRVMQELDRADLPVTRAVDFYLGLVETEEAVRRIEYYLFNGSQIQRNYCTLYFSRRNEWKKVNRAYELGLIDRIQAYSR